MLNDEQLKELEDMASTFMDLSSLEIIMSLPEGFLADAIYKKSPEGISVLKGRLKTEARIRKCVIDLAIAGSAPAQAMAVKYIDEAKIAELSSY